MITQKTPTPDKVLSHATPIISLPYFPANLIEWELTCCEHRRALETFISGSYYVTLLTCARGLLLGLSATSHVLASSLHYDGGV